MKKLTVEEIYDKYIGLLVAVNDETKTESIHNVLSMKLGAWKQGIMDATGQHLNGDYHYIGMIDNGEFEDRPMCCGEFLDWKHTPPLSNCCSAPITEPDICSECKEHCEEE